MSAGSELCVCVVGVVYGCHLGLDCGSLCGDYFKGFVFGF